MSEASPEPEFVEPIPFWVLWTFVLVSGVVGVLVAVFGFEGGNSWLSRAALGGLTGSGGALILATNRLIR